MSKTPRASSRTASETACTSESGKADSSGVLQKIKAEAIGAIPSEWRIVSVQELIAEGVLEGIQDGNHGESHPVESDYVPSGVPFLMSGCIRDGRVRMEDAKYITPEHARSLRVGHAHRGDVLLTHKGNQLGRVAILTEVDWAVLTPQITYYRIRKPSALLPQYLKYLFESPGFQHQFKRDADQSTRPFVSITNQKSLYLPIPPIEIQRGIADVLSSLDDKIELNRRMNETLEGMARAIFKSWFVDFDPVRAKAAGCQPSGMDADTAALFPDCFEDSPLGPIPFGWMVHSMQALVNLSRETLSPGNSPNETFAHFSIPAFDEGRLPVLEQGACIKSNKSVVAPGAVLLSKLNPRIPRVWLPNGSAGVRQVCSTEFLVTTPTSDTTAEYLWALFLSAGFIERFASLVTGTSGSHQRVKPEYLLALQSLVPSRATVTRFTEVAGPLLRRVAQGLRESQSLASARDALLPKLLSGDVSVGDFGKDAVSHA